MRRGASERGAGGRRPGGRRRRRSAVTQRVEIGPDTEPGSVVPPPPQVKAGSAGQGLCPAFRRGGGGAHPLSGLGGPCLAEATWVAPARPPTRARAADPHSKPSNSQAWSRPAGRPCGLRAAGRQWRSPEVTGSPFGAASSARGSSTRRLPSGTPTSTPRGLSCECKYWHCTASRRNESRALHDGVGGRTRVERPPAPARRSEIMICKLCTQSLSLGDYYFIRSHNLTI